MTLSMYIASVAWMLLLCGWLLRRYRRFHIPLVLAGIFLDISLVAYLQVTRAAVQTALEFRLSGFQQAHIGLSTTAFVLYLPVLWLGMRLFHDPTNGQLRKVHRTVAVTALIFRTLGFLFMFSMLRQFR